MKKYNIITASCIIISSSLLLIILQSACFASDIKIIEKQFIAVLNKNAKIAGNWKFINSDGWKIKDDNNNVSISQDSEGTYATTTLLSLAVMNDWPAAVKFILDKGGNINAPDSQMDTPLHKASYLGLNEMVNLLIKKGADVNAANRDGNTPLHSTTFHTRYKTAEILLKNGADVNAVNINGETPIFMLKDYLGSSSDSTEEMIGLFEKYGGMDE